MEDLPKPVWDLLAQKIDDAKTWFSFVQVSRLTRFLGKKYMKEKQNQFSYFYYENGVCYEKSLPNGKQLKGSDAVIVNTGYSITKFSSRNGITYCAVYSPKMDICPHPRVHNYSDLKKYIKKFYTISELNFNGMQITVKNMHYGISRVFTVYGDGTATIFKIAAFGKTLEVPF